MVSARRACRDGFAYIKPTRVCQKNNPPRKCAKINQLINSQINDNANVIQIKRKPTEAHTNVNQTNERTNDPNDHTTNKRTSVQTDAETNDQTKKIN